MSNSLLLRHADKPALRAWTTRLLSIATLLFLLAALAALATWGVPSRLRIPLGWMLLGATVHFRFRRGCRLWCGLDIFRSAATIRTSATLWQSLVNFLQPVLNELSDLDIAFSSFPHLIAWNCNLGVVQLIVPTSTLAYSCKPF